MLKYIKTSIITLSLAFSFIAPAYANTIHTVQSGDTFWNIGMRYGVSYESIKQINNRQSNNLYPGEQLTIQQSIPQSDLDLLARLVRAEAIGEPYAGKVAVATVVLNRVKNDQFPNSISGVIYDKSASGHYAFTPVANGQINQPADAESIQAVKEALTFQGQGNGSLYFYNPKTATSDWIKSRPVTVTIGNHVFAK